MAYKGNMNAEATATRVVPQLLSAWLGEPVESEVRIRRGPCEVDLVVRGRGVTVVVEVKGTDRIPAVEAAHHYLLRCSEHLAGIPVLAVPYMGPKARQHARSLDLSWMDLSGNADIRGPGLRIFVDGKPNRFASRGRPSTAFSDKAARLSRAMLAEPERWWRQSELAQITNVSAGYVSKVIGRLAEDDLLDLSADGELRPRSPSLLLDAWEQAYDFRRHEIGRYHAVGRTGPSIAEAVAGRLASVPSLKGWAATGLAAAWALDRFADHRLVTFYVSRPLLDPELLGLRPVEKGENVWLVAPRDEGVFHAAREVSGLLCAHPVQVYLDLLAHPERAREAAEHLRAHSLGWSAA